VLGARILLTRPAGSQANPENPWGSELTPMDHVKSGPIFSLFEPMRINAKEYHDRAEVLLDLT
jgi:hypothetical protein